MQIFALFLSISNRLNEITVNIQSITLTLTFFVAATLTFLINRPHKCNEFNTLKPSDICKTVKHNRGHKIKYILI